MLQLLLAILLGLSATTATAQDPVLVRPNEYKVEIENSRVRVLRVKRGPHGKVSLHEHPAAVAIYLTDARQKITGADGTTREATRKAGEVVFNAATRHEEENISDQPMEVVLIELKSGPGKFVFGPLDPIKAAPKQHSVVLENERVRVIRSTREPHETSPLHGHPDYVVVWMTDLHSTIKLADGRVIDNIRKAGEVAWRDALQHTTVNESDHVAVELQMELK